jgi:hypothetical protein
VRRPQQEATALIDDAMAHDAHDGYAQNRGALLSGMKAAEAIHHGLNNLLS